MNDQSDLVTVYISQGQFGAEVAKSKLESEGILVSLRYQSVGRVLGLTVDGLGRVEVQVRADDVDLARDLLTAIEPEQGEPDVADL